MVRILKNRSVPDILSVFDTVLFVPWLLNLGVGTGESRPLWCWQNKKEESHSTLSPFSCSGHELFLTIEGLTIYLLLIAFTDFHVSFFEFPCVRLIWKHWLHIQHMTDWTVTGRAVMNSLSRCLRYFCRKTSIFRHLILQSIVRYVLTIRNIKI